MSWRAIQPALQSALSPWQGRLFAVGGAVRDERLGRPAGNDLDIVVLGDAAEVAQSLYDQGLAPNHPSIYARFGTAMVRVQNVDVEFAMARQESYQEDSRKPSVEPASLEQDALRRDFTVNTLMVDLFTDQLVDLTGSGQADLDARLLRTPKDPGQTFSDDPLRMLRAVRFAAQLDFAYAPGLEDAIAEQASRLQVISQERIRDELTRIMANPRAGQAWRDLERLGLLRQFAPELAANVGVEQGDYHHLDVWHHSVVALENTEGDTPAVRWAALLHDIGKAPTRTVEDDGRVRFFNHENVGADLAARLLRRLRFSDNFANEVWLLIRHHMRFMGIQGEMSAPAARRLVRDLGDQLEPLLRLCDADAGALKKGVRRFDPDRIRARVADVRLRAPQSRFESPLDGGEIMREFDIEPGPAIGHLKHYLAELVIQGGIAPDDTEAARAKLRELNVDATAWERVTSGNLTETDVEDQI